MNTNDAADALQDFADGSGITAAEDMARAFEIAGERISSALERAAQTGEFSFSAMAESIARDLARLAITQLVTNPLEQALGGVTQSLTRSLGQSLGQPLGSKPGVTVNMSIPGISDAEGFKKSQGQISAQLARAVADGQRFT